MTKEENLWGDFNIVISKDAQADRQKPTSVSLRRSPANTLYFRNLLQQSRTSCYQLPTPYEWTA